MTNALEDHEVSVSIGGRTIKNLHFADDINALVGKEEELFNLVNQLDKASTTSSMDFSAEKTELITNNIRGISSDIRINGQNLEAVQSFKYLVSLMTDEGSKQEILSRIAQTVGASSMERQEHCPQLQNQNGAFLGHFNLPALVRNMDNCSRVIEEDTTYGNEMPPDTPGHLLQGLCYE